MWVEMRSGGACEPPREFSRHCHIRLLQRAHLWGAVSLAGDVDVICLDFDHPDIDGLQFAVETKTKFPSIPLIMLIGQQSTDIVLWALRARIFDVLIKPISAQEVLRVFDRLMPILAAKRTQTRRVNMATPRVVPDEARFRTKNHQHDKLEMVREFIILNFTRQIDEAEVSAMCGMSAMHFSRCFRKAFSMTFRDFVTDCRIKQAQRLLNNPDVAITDIAALVGFNDPSYFARLFRKRVGTTPTDFRESLASKANPPSDAEERLVVAS